MTNLPSCEEILTDLKSKGADLYRLDDLVHDAASNIASNINNSGPLEQIEYLMSLGYTHEEILREIV